MGARVVWSADGRPSQLHLDALQAVAVGTGYHEIAARIHVSRRTVARLIEDLKRHTGTSGLPELVAEAARHGWLQETTRTDDGAGVLPRPSQLPPDPVGFTGRSRHLAALDDLIPVGGAHVSRSAVAAIRGMAGVGKTALAVHWAHRVSPLFPDGQLYLNLHGFDPSGDPMSSQEALRLLLGALIPAPDRLPAKFEALQGWYRSVLTSQRILILLDNARDAAQVRPLLPAAAGCLVIITSRDQLSGLVATDGAAPVDLGVLSEAEARDLLSVRIGQERAAAEPEAVKEFIDRCACLPLALAVLAAKAADCPSFALGSLAEQIRDAGLGVFDSGDTATDVRAVFSWSYRTLSPGAAQLFRLLGAHCRSDFAISAAASLIGRPISLTRGLLGELTRAHLAIEQAPGRYGIHDLLRVFAQELAARHDTGPVEELAALRLLDHYLHTAHRADTLLQQHMPPNAIQLLPAQPGMTVGEFADRDQAIAWLAVECESLVAAAMRAATAGFPRHAWQLAWCLRTFLYWRGHQQDRLDTLRAALTATVELGDGQAQALIHRALGNAIAGTGRHEEALEHGRIALGMFAELNDTKGLARAHHDMATLCLRFKRHAEALEHATAAHELCEAIGDRDGMARALNAAGWLNSQLGEHKQALVLCGQALQLLQDTPHYPEYAYTLDSIGHAYQQLGDLDQAIIHYQQAVDALNSFSDQTVRAEILLHLADAQQAAGHPDLASRQTHRALTILDGIQDPRGATNGSGDV